MTKIAPVPILFERIARILQNDAHRHGLKPTQWEALRFLARANRFSRNPSALTAYLGMTKGTVSQTLLALEKKGLITKSISLEDKRSVKLLLTEQGKEFVKSDPLQAINQAMQAEDELSLQLENILRGMLEKREGRAFGVCKTCTHFRVDASSGKPHFCSLLSEPLSAEDSEAICIEQEVL